jgi:hypothetical protein
MLAIVETLAAIDIADQHIRTILEHFSADLRRVWRAPTDTVVANLAIRIGIAATALIETLATVIRVGL